jgi:hypothetical protein
MFLLTKHSLARVTRLIGLGLNYWELDSSYHKEHAETAEPNSYILVEIETISTNPNRSVQSIIEFITEDLNRYAFMVHDVENQNYLHDIGIPPNHIIRIPPDSDKFDEYLNCLIVVLESGLNFGIGTHTPTDQNAAGILPVLYHNSNLYAMLGLDSRTCRYSDFGGCFDQHYSPNSHKRRDSYKNAILGEYQIQNGMISHHMLIDHLLNLSPDDRQVFMDDLREGRVGHGDLNTLYTAFREYVEETSGKNRAGRVCHPIDIQKVFRKLFIDKAYIHLRSDKSYGYDTYVVFFTIDDLDFKDRGRLRRQISLIRASPSVYLREMAKPYQRRSHAKNKSGSNSPNSSISSNSSISLNSSTSSISSINSNQAIKIPIRIMKRGNVDHRVTRHSMSNTNGMPDIGIYQKLQIRDGGVTQTTDANCTNMYQSVDAGYTIYGNSEMRRIDLFPLPELLQLMKGVDYTRYSFFNTNHKRKLRRSDKEFDKPREYHAQTYNAPFYDKMRSSFADAMVKYNPVLTVISESFETFKDALV